MTHVHQNRDRRATAVLAGLCALVLCGCTTTAPPPPALAPVEPATPPAPDPREDGLSQFEARQRVRALVLEDQERWAEAAWAWEVLTVLRPAHAPYRAHAAALQQRIAAGVAEQLERAQSARQRGAMELAGTHYLQALVLQPDNVQAADALRTLERERNRRLYLGKPSRLTILRRGGTEAAPRMRPAEVPAAGRPLP